MSSTWARLATSGTTPPKRACRSIWLDTTDEQHDAAVLDHRGRGLVARRLDAEDERHQRRASSTTVSPGSMRSIESSSSAYSGWSTSCTHITSASSLTSW